MRVGGSWIVNTTTAGTPGSMERPGLTRLLQDIDAGRIDTIVVYKVDRLTRSLADFAKMIERFDVSSVSFVWVTQQFITTTSSFAPTALECTFEQA